jgi:hypothetical protein
MYVDAKKRLETIFVLPILISEKFEGIPLCSIVKYVIY